MNAENNENEQSWLAWLVIVPLCVALGAFGMRLALRQVAVPQPAATAEEPQPPAPAAEEPSFELPGDDVSGGEASVLWGSKPGGAKAGRDNPETQAPPIDPREAQKHTRTGFIRGALTKAAGKALNNPGAAAALFNNDYVVKGFMSRDTVKKATASKAALASFLKNPAYLSNFMAAPEVKQGLKNRELVNAVAGSRLVGEMLATPGGTALLGDPATMASVLKENPALATALTNPAILTALLNNPKAAGVVTQIMASPR